MAFQLKLYQRLEKTTLFHLGYVEQYCCFTHEAIKVMGPILCVYLFRT